MIGALTVPATSPVALTLTETVLLDPAATLPDVGLILNQAALSDADQVKVPPPVLLIVRDWEAGFEPPCAAVKDKLVGPAPITGGTGAAATVKVTGTETGVAPVAVIEIMPV